MSLGPDAMWLFWFQQWSKFFDFNNCTTSLPKGTTEWNLIFAGFIGIPCPCFTFKFTQRRISRVEWNLSIADMMGILLLFLALINLSKLSSSNNDAGDNIDWQLWIFCSWFILVHFLQVIRSTAVKFHPSSLLTGHPLASARGGSGHPNTRGVDCEAGRNNTFTFRSSKTPFHILFKSMFPVFAFNLSPNPQSELPHRRVAWGVWGGRLQRNEPNPRLGKRSNLHNDPGKAFQLNFTQKTLLLERDKTYTMIQARLSNQILHQNSSLGEGQTYTILLA